MLMIGCDEAKKKTNCQLNARIWKASITNEWTLKMRWLMSTIRIGKKPPISRLDKLDENRKTSVAFEMSKTAAVSPDVNFCLYEVLSGKSALRIFRKSKKL